MIKFFNIKGEDVSPTDEILRIPVFKKIWVRDKNRKKALAKLEFSYIDFMTSIRDTNPYKDCLDSEKSKIIINDLFVRKDYHKWKVNDLVSNGIKFIKKKYEEQSSYYVLYKKMKDCMQKLIDDIIELRITKTNDKGLLLYKPEQIIKLQKSIPELIKEIKSLEKKVQQELYNKSSGKGGRKINEFEKVSKVSKVS